MSQPEILRWDQAYNRNGDPKLPRAVVNVIRTYMNNHTLDGWVSQETLARDTGLDESNVRRQIKKNVDAGWLEVSKRGRSGRASEYRLTYPQPGADARLTRDTTEVSTGRICPVTPSDGPDLNRANMPGCDPLPGEYARLLPGADARPTSPRTSPQEKFFRETPTGSPAVAGRTAATGVADGRGRGGPSLGQAASELAAQHTDPFGSGAEPATGTEAPEGLVGLTPATARGSKYSNPFEEDPFANPFSPESERQWAERRAELRACEERQDRALAAAAARQYVPAGPDWD